MKNTSTSILIVIMNIWAINSQVTTGNEPRADRGMHQIRIVDAGNITKFQACNIGLNNYVLLWQTGVQNSVSIKQNSGTTSKLGNESYNNQTGNFNELTVEQIGNGNTVFSSQVGNYAIKNTDYLLYKIDVEKQNNAISKQMFNTIWAEGEHNKLNLEQKGEDNLVYSVQQGTDNSISAKQTNNQNILLIIQKGTGNEVNNYNQQNKSAHKLYDKIIQMGESNYLDYNEVSTGAIQGNTFTQIGNKLSVELNNGMMNSPGGIDVNQKGKEMNVIIDQSFFSFPMK